MGHVRTVVLITFALATVAGSAVAPAASVAGATEPVDPVETPGGTPTPTETTPTPDDGPDVHADDPFPRWLPVAFAGVLVVGVVAVGGGLRVVCARTRRFFGR